MPILARKHLHAEQGAEILGKVLLFHCRISVRYHMVVRRTLAPLLKVIEFSYVCRSRRDHLLRSSSEQQFKMRRHLYLTAAQRKT